MSRAARRWWFMGALLIMVGCAALTAQPTADVLPTSAAPAPAASSAAQVDVTSDITTTPAPSGAWHTLYRRDGFAAAGSVDVRAVGDIMLGRDVAPVVSRRPAEWLFGPTAELLAGDLVLGNLESPFARVRRPDALRRGPFRLPADPELVDRLAPFDALSVANNHALDAGIAGLRDTWATLQAADIGVVGSVGRGCTASGPAAGSRSAGVRIVAFNAVRDPEDSTEDPACGRAWLDQTALAEVAALRAAASQPIVVLVHWGDEYSPTPSAMQQEWGRQLVAAGADLVLGAHPHVVQPAALVEAGARRGYVAYSLGNFVFDQADRSATSHGVVLRVLLDADGVGEVQAAAIAIRNGQPVPLSADEPAAAAQLRALQPDTSSAEPTRRQAWRWDGTTYASVAVDGAFALPAPPRSADIDLRGDGAPLRLTLRDGLVQLWDADAEVWRNEAAAWQVAGFTAGDADNDGRFEALLQLWKPDADGVLRSHPFMLGWRGGHYRIFWGGSAVATPIQAAAIGRVGGDRNALVVLEGGARPGDPATHVAVWTWQGWNFQQQWRSAAGTFHHLALRDLDGDGTPEIVAE